MYEENHFRLVFRLSRRKMPEEQLEILDGTRNAVVTFPGIELFLAFSPLHWRSPIKREKPSTGWIRTGSAVFQASGMVCFHSPADGFRGVFFSLFRTSLIVNWPGSCNAFSSLHSRGTATGA